MNNTAVASAFVWQTVWQGGATGSSAVQVVLWLEGKALGDTAARLRGIPAGFTSRKTSSKLYFFKLKPKGGTLLEELHPGEGQVSRDSQDDQP